MTRKYLLPLLALCGALLGLFIVFKTQKKVAVPPILFPPAVSPYENSIAGAGIIEASSNNIAVGTPFNEIVTKVHVTEGDRVQVGDILFELDLRNFNAQLEVAKASLNEAIVVLEDKRKQFSFYERVKDPRAVSEQAYQLAHYAFLEAEKNVQIAQANLEVAQSNIDRSIIRAPISGAIFQVNIHPGELAPVNPFFSNQSTAQTVSQGSIMLMGAIDPFQVRIDIDEDDAWRYKEGARATGFVRGNSNINFPLDFFKLEPYIIPKSSFTGQTTERVDTRVLQVLYNFEKGDLPVYAGQVLDIFIESEPINTVVQR
ncbi:MAG: secretion protein HlyD [Verrucomicrobia bacterium]|nr:MAG: secretion protein HlyD [Verrucomicrobiota bacterium]